MVAADTKAEVGGARRWTVGRVTVALVVGLMVTMWGYVLYLAIGPGRQDSPDRLADRGYATAAQERCTKALAEVAALPPAAAAANDGADIAARARERASVVERANRSFALMLDDLERMAPAGEEGQLVRAWLADWRTYLADRVAYVRDLRADPQARLLVSPKRGQQITEYLDAFSRDNSMPACATPIDA